MSASRSILLAAENDAYLDGLAALLSARGFVVVAHANSADEALGRAQLLQPDIVLLDLSLPGGNGFETTRRLKELANPPAVVVLTFHTSHAIESEARSAGADGCLGKTELSALFATLENLHINTKEPGGKNIVRRFPNLVALAIAALALLAPPAEAAKLQSQNLTELIAGSQSIVYGSVESVTDGIAENGLPYTEVTIAVGASAKGSLEAGSTYTFRQFGLLKPRKLANGKTLIAVAPDGFPRWKAGQTVMAFLNQPASITGLQTTVGLEQGLLTVENGKITNDLRNAGLFAGVEVSSGLLSAAEKQMLVSEGPVDAATFVGLVSHAVASSWIENGEMR